MYICGYWIEKWCRKMETLYERAATSKNMSEIGKLRRKDSPTQVDGQNWMG
jgi:hypothetical protein